MRWRLFFVVACTLCLAVAPVAGESCTQENQLRRCTDRMGDTFVTIWSEGGTVLRWESDSNPKDEAVYLVALIGLTMATLDPTSNQASRADTFRRVAAGQRVRLGRFEWSSERVNNRVVFRAVRLQ